MTKVTRVLIIDDMPEDAEILMQKITNTGESYSLDFVNNSQKAFELIEQEMPDCILLDYRLGPEDGLEVLEKAASIPDICPIIMLTGQGTEKVAVAAILGGASDYLIKPEASGTDLRMSITRVIERREMQLRIAQQEQELQRKGRLQALGELSAGIAHDFNNMLATIRFGAEGVRRAPSSPKSRAKLDVILQTVDRAAERVEGLLVFSSKQQNRLSTRETSDVFDELGTMVHDLGSGATLLEFWPCDPDVAVYCDQSLLQHALLNLVVNARDAVAERHGDAKIVVLAREVENAQGVECVEFSVSDNGMGIDPTILSQVTDPYFTTKKSQGGTGIGLSMVQAFAGQSEGSLTIESTPGEGTIAKLTLPIGDRSPSPIAAKKVGPKRRRQKTTVLAVEDQAMLLLMIKEELEDAGYNVLTAHSGRQALEHLSTLTATDILLTDIVLGGKMDGFSIAAEAKVRCPGIKAIGISGYQNIGTAEDEALFDKLLAKPCGPNELVSALEELLK